MIHAALMQTHMRAAHAPKRRVPHAGLHVATKNRLYKCTLSA